MEGGVSEAVDDIAEGPGGVDSEQKTKHVHVQVYVQIHCTLNAYNVDLTFRAAGG